MLVSQNNLSSDIASKYDTFAHSISKILGIAGVKEQRDI
jgi:hypothetical protein